MFNLDLDKISSLKLLFIFGLIFNFFGSYLFLFIFRNDFFSNLDSIVLIFLAIALSLPFSILGSMVFCFTSANIKKDKKEINLYQEDINGAFFVSYLIGGFIFYITSFIGMFFKINFQNAFLIIMIINILFYSGFLCFGVSSKNKT